MKQVIIKGIYFCLCFFLILNTRAVVLSVASDFNSYVQVYDSMGAIVAADFVIGDKVLQANTGIIKLDRVRWLGLDRKVYEYRFDPASAVQNNAIRFYKEDNTFSVGQIESNGVVTPVGRFQANFYLMYD